MARVWVGFLVLVLLLPELALLGFFTAGVVLALPAQLPHRADVVVVLGGSGDGERYRKGTELLRQGFSRQLVLIKPSAAERKDALAMVPGVVFWDDVLPGNT